MRGDIETDAAKLAGKLRQVTEEFLVHENRDRPDYLEQIMSPRWRRTDVHGLDRHSRGRRREAPSDATRPGPSSPS